MAAEKALMLVQWMVLPKANLMVVQLETLMVEQKAVLTVVLKVDQLAD
jgi:hypothetical protein